MPVSAGNTLCGTWNIASESGKGTEPLKIKKGSSHNVVPPFWYYR
jgi:hypothetical protein